MIYFAISTVLNKCYKVRLYDALINSMGHCLFIDVTVPQLILLLTALSFVSLIVTHVPASFVAEND